MSHNKLSNEEFTILRHLSFSHYIARRILGYVHLIFFSTPLPLSTPIAPPLPLLTLLSLSHPIRQGQCGFMGRGQMRWRIPSSKAELKEPQHRSLPTMARGGSGIPPAMGEHEEWQHGSPHHGRARGSITIDSLSPSARKTTITIGFTSQW